MGFAHAAGFAAARRCLRFLVTKIIATRCQILRLKCIKIDFGWGSVLGLLVLCPRPAGSAYSALGPDRPPSWNKGYLFLSGEAGCMEGTRRTERGWQGTGEEGKRREGTF